MDIFSTHIQILIGDLSRVLDDGSPSQESAEALMIKAERVHHLMATLVDVVPGMESNLPLIESVISSLSNVISLTAGSHADEYNGYSARFTSGGRGRPKVEIPRNTLEYLIGNHFSVHRVAYLLQTSVSTVRRQMHDFGLSSIRSTYSVISDAQLDTLVRQIQYQYPNCGYRLLKGHLAAMGYRYRIQEKRIRDSLRRVDPVGIMSRWICANQRTYSVSGPNALWHIYGNHKLIR